MLEKLYHMTYAELPHTYDAWKHLATGGSLGHDFYADDPEIFPGLKNGRRNTEVQASLYDAMLAEMINDRNAEKAKVRNRRRADRSHKMTPKERKHMEEMRKDRMFGYYFNKNCPKVMFCPDSEPIKNRKYAEGDRIAREDWETEKSQHADAMAEYYDYVDFTEDHWNRFERAWDANHMSNAEYWRSRANETQKIADALYSGEEYYRRNKSFGVRADIYLRLYKEADKWLQWA